MQTTIGKTLALGIPGEFVNTNIYRVDARLTGESVNLGSVVCLDTDGKIKKSKAGANAYGIAVTTHQHVAFNGPTDEYAPTLAVQQNTEVGFLTMGDVFVEVSFADGSAPKVGAKVYYTVAGGAISTTATGNTLLGTVVLASNEIASDATKAVFGVRIG